jgi:hypothetical protein
MKDQLESLLAGLKSNSISFIDVLDFIDTYYQHTPTAFMNGEVFNASTQNQGSVKVLAFAQINNLNVKDTLYLFAEHYQSVLEHPNAVDHQNIRQFITHGWKGVKFEGQALTALSA